MNDNQCASCIFSDQCRSMKPCSDYYPFGDLAEDEFLIELLQEDRCQFLLEWEEYIQEF